MIFGLHWGLVPLAMINYGLLGYDFILSPYFCVSFAQTFVVLAIILKTKDEKLKKIAIPAFISENVLQVLQKNYNLTPTSEPEKDLNAILQMNH